VSQRDERESLQATTHRSAMKPGPGVTASGRLASRNTASDGEMAACGIGVFYVGPCFGGGSPFQR
jgi:hypothetical protein